MNDTQQSTQSPLHKIMEPRVAEIYEETAIELGISPLELWRRSCLRHSDSEVPMSITLDAETAAKFELIAYDQGKSPNALLLHMAKDLVKNVKP